MSNNSDSNKRIARNTIYLYFRTILLMLITLYTSRVVLNTLGVVDFGIHNAVAGVVYMFSVLTGALSVAIVRYITFEQGKSADNPDRLKLIFSTSLRIQFLFGIVILILGETVGLWFLNDVLNIPPDRLSAANGVWQCVLLSFLVSLVNVPYNATIVAHEHMSAYAIMSIVKAVLKLLMCYMLVISPFDKLVTYAILLVAVDVVIFFAYVAYCKHYFCECVLVKVRDHGLYREMFSFAGFSFMNNAATIFNTQGLNVLVNMFFGVALNAARGIATQVEGAIMQLVDNFTMAVNPQITKSYAVSDYSRMFGLVCMSSKVTYFLFLVIVIPMFLETEYVLKIWLNIVPDHAVAFVRLALIGGVIKLLSNTSNTACMATGTIKKYSVWTTLVSILAFPLTWGAFMLGRSAEYAYVMFIVTYIAVLIVRLVMMRQLLGFNPMMFLRDVVLKIFIVTPAAAVVPILVSSRMSDGFIRLCVVSVISVISTFITVYYLGLNKRERGYFVSIIKNKLSIIFRK